MHVNIPRTISQSINPALIRRDVLGVRLGELAARLEGLQRSFESIQDFVRAYSPALWQREYFKFVQCASLLPVRVPSLILILPASEASK